MRITRVGLYSNVLLTIGKFGAGILGNSSALIADGFHSVSDLLSDFVTLATIKFASQPATNERPYGNGKLEEIGTGVISIILMGTSVGIGYNAVDDILQLLHVVPVDAIAAHSHAHLDTTIPPPSTADKTQGMWALIQDALSSEGHGHSHSLVTVGGSPSWLAFNCAVIAVLVKEALFRSTLNVAKLTKSKIVEANAYHHRSDALSSLVAVLGVGFSMASMPIMDPLAALVVACMIGKQSVEMWQEVWLSITDSTDKTVQANIERAVAECTHIGLIGFHAVKARKMGRYFVVDISIIVPAKLSVSASHQVAEQVRKHVMKTQPDVRQVLVHVDVEGDLEFTPNIHIVCEKPVMCERSHLCANKVCPKAVHAPTGDTPVPSVSETGEIAHKHDSLMRSQIDIERDIVNVSKKSCFGDVKIDVHAITCHFIAGQLTSNIEISITRPQNNTLTVEELKQIAAQFKHEIEHDIEDMEGCDISLRLTSNM